MIRRHVGRGAIAIAAILGIGICTLLVAYTRDREGTLRQLCKAGFPNLSRPSYVRATDLQCKILGPKRRVSGILITGDEASNLLTNDLGPGTTWFLSNQTQPRSPALDKQLSTPVKGVCDTGMASVTVEGRATVSLGTYGHLGSYARTFFVEKVISVRPPPTRVVRKWQAGFAQMGACSDFPK